MNLVICENILVCNEITRKENRLNCCVHGIPHVGIPVYDNDPEAPVCNAGAEECADLHVMVTCVPVASVIRRTLCKEK